MISRLQLDNVHERARSVELIELQSTVWMKVKHLTVQRRASTGVFDTYLHSRTTMPRGVQEQCLGEGAQGLELSVCWLGREHAFVQTRLLSFYK